MDEYTIQDVRRLIDLMDGDKSNKSIDMTEKRRIMIADGLDLLVEQLTNRMIERNSPQ